MATFNFKSNEELLEKAKQDKMDELSQLCKDAILAGFSCEIQGSPYWFSYDKEAQVNIIDTKDLFVNNSIDEITWNGRVGGRKDGPRVRLSLSKDEFYHLYLSSVKHKLHCISKLRDDLVELVRESRTMSQVQSINWDSIQESTFRKNLRDDDTLEQNVGKLRDLTNDLNRKTDSVSQTTLELATLLMSLGL